MPEAVMATKSTDQGWPPPPIKSKCLERVSSRYVRRRMAAALLARVGMIQSAAAKTVPRILGSASLIFVRLTHDRRFVGTVFVLFVLFVFIRISGRHCVTHDREGIPVY